MHKTDLYSYHLDCGGKMVNFAGWEMPLHYGSIIAEHQQVRSTGGLFDVSHMGRFAFDGPGAGLFLDQVCTRSIRDMKDGRARYSIICNEHGGCLDDVLVYRKSAHAYLMICNASNRKKLLTHFQDAGDDDPPPIRDLTMHSAMIALQGPDVIQHLSEFVPDVAALPRYSFLEFEYEGRPLVISRTGYTGEDGVEIMIPLEDKTDSGPFLHSLIDRFAGSTLPPAGLGCRNSLRLEAGMALYGHELTEEIDPLAAGLRFAVSLDKEIEGSGGFVGQEALRAVDARGPAQVLVGLVLDKPRGARQGMPLFTDAGAAGNVTSGAISPTLRKSIAMAYVNAGMNTPGTTLLLDMGRQEAQATVVPLPFLSSR